MAVHYFVKLILAALILNEFKRAFHDWPIYIARVSVSKFKILQGLVKFVFVTVKENHNEWT